jgi:hypothetical protein
MHPQASANGHCLMVTSDAQIIPLKLHVDACLDGDVRVAVHESGAPLASVHFFCGDAADFILRVLRLNDSLQHTSDQLVDSGVA